MKTTISPEIKAVDLEVDKITCQSCVNFIEKNLSDMDGITTVRANLAGSRVNVRYLPEKTDLNSIRKRLDDINYKVKTVKSTVDIEGMHCASCVSRIENSLANMEGVTNVSVNLADQTARVEYIEPLTGVSSIIQKIEDAGYKASYNEDELGKESAKRDYHQRLLLKFRMALPFTFLIFFI
jgi:Cu+-exporting ATPase